MNKNDYYHMAVKSGLWQSTHISDNALMAISLMEFVDMVVREEREACAKFVENCNGELGCQGYLIRARGEK